MVKRETCRIVAIFLVLFSAAALYAGDRKEYVVRKGDTLSDIIVMLRVEKVDVQKISEWNHGLGTQVQVGQIIVYHTTDTPLPPVTRAEAKEEAERVVGEFAKKLNENVDVANRRESKQMVLILIGLVVFVLSVGGFILHGAIARRNREVQSATVDLAKVIDTFRVLNSGLPIAHLDGQAHAKDVTDYGEKNRRSRFIFILNLANGSLAPCIVSIAPGRDPIVYHKIEDIQPTADERPNATWRNRRRNSLALHFPQTDGATQPPASPPSTSPSLLM